MLSVGDISQYQHVIFNTTTGAPAVLPQDSAVTCSDVAPLGSLGVVGYTPQQIRTAYGITGIAGNGAGQTIAVVDAYDDPNIAADLHAFDQQFGSQLGVLTDPAFTKVNQTGGSTYPSPNSGWVTEIALDVEWAHAIAPGASILLVEATDNSNTNLYAAVDRARTVSGVVAVSMSWGGSESSSETGYDTHFTTPTGHTGITFLAATGDDGWPGIYPAYSPNVVAVGGTTLTLSGNNYASETGWSDSGGGQSSYESRPSYQNAVQARRLAGRSPTWPSTPIPTRAWPCTIRTTAAPIRGTKSAAPVFPHPVGPAWWPSATNSASPRDSAAMDGRSDALPLLYSMAAADYHDITSGSNGGYSAAPGYDMVTGRGTPVADKLVLDFAPATPRGTVAFSTHVYQTGDSATITVRDSNAASCQVTLVATSGDSETLALASLGSGTFQGTIATSSGGSAPNDGALHVVPGDTVTVTYTDADDGTGNTATTTDQATVRAPLQITTASPLPAAGLGQPYSVTLAATGGVGAMRWSVPAVGNLCRERPGHGMAGRRDGQGLARRRRQLEPVASLLVFFLRHELQLRLGLQQRVPGLHLQCVAVGQQPVRTQGGRPHCAVVGRPGHDRPRRRHLRHQQLELPGRPLGRP